MPSFFFRELQLIIVLLLITWLREIYLTSLIALLWNFSLFWSFPLMICDFPLFSHSKNIRMSTLITIIITYYLLIINYHYYNNYKKSQWLLSCRSYGAMLIKFVNMDWLFLCNSYPCVLFESLSHKINQESHVYSWNLGKIYLVHFPKF